MRSEDLIDYLERKRTQLGINQASLARMLNLAIGTWMRYHHRERKLTGSVVQRVFRTFPTEHGDVLSAFLATDFSTPSRGAPTA